MTARRVTFRVRPPLPFGEVTLVPTALSGRSESDMGRAMSAALDDLEAPTAAEALGRLRLAFPAAPLGARMAALNLIMERLRRAS